MEERGKVVVREGGGEGGCMHIEVCAGMTAYSIRCSKVLIDAMLPDCLHASKKTKTSSAPTPRQMKMARLWTCAK